MRNPYIDSHIAAETDFQNGNRPLAEAMVMHEYAGAPDPVDCTCGSKAFYKATVGAMICPSCRSMYDSNGRAY